MRVVRLYIQYDRSAAATIRELRYPSRKALYLPSPPDWLVEVHRTKAIAWREVPTDEDLNQRVEQAGRKS